MQIGAISFRPYIFNTNILSRNSLSKISGIGDDLLTGKTDYSSLTDESLNENPLKKGQTLNFMDVLDRQMQMGRMNASRIMTSENGEQTLKADVPAKLQTVNSAEETSNMQFEGNQFQMQRAVEAYRVNMLM